MMLLKGFLTTDALVSILPHLHGSKGNGKTDGDGNRENITLTLQKKTPPPSENK